MRCLHSSTLSLVKFDYFLEPTRINYNSRKRGVQSVNNPALAPETSPSSWHGVLMQLITRLTPARGFCQVDLHAARLFRFANRFALRQPHFATGLLPRWEDKEEDEEPWKRRRHILLAYVRRYIVVEACRESIIRANSVRSLL